MYLFFNTGDTEMNKQIEALPDVQALAKLPRKELLAGYAMGVNALHGCLKIEAVPPVVMGCQGIIEEFQRRARRDARKASGLIYRKDAFVMNYELGEVMERYYPEIAGELAHA